MLATVAMAAVLPVGSAVASAEVAPSSLGQAVLERQFQTRMLPFLKTNCYPCHGQGHHKGDITLDRFTNFAAVQSDRKTWQSVHDELEQHEMPPKKAKVQPTASDLTAALTFTSDALNFVDLSAPIDPGFVPIHRLNRNEYNNTIRDLVGVDFHPADDFPADDTGYGFDNIADVLSMSPLLAEKYLSAAEQVMDRAIVTDNPNRPMTVKYSVDKMKGGEMIAGDSRILATNGQITQTNRFAATGTYEFRIEAEADQAGDEPAKMDLRLGDRTLHTFNVRNSRGRPRVFTYRATVDAGQHTIVMAFTNDFYDPDAPNPHRRDRNLIVDSLEIHGPIDLPPPPPSAIQKRLLFCGPADGLDGEACAKNIIRRFAGRAFRRPATESEVDGLLRLYRISRAQGDTFQQACKVPLTAVLVMPQFLYRIETDPADHPERPHPLNDYELASRLSYFLWSSMPDDELLEQARAGRLHEPDVLDAQVKRMLADPKSEALINNFAGQWLELRNLAIANPDPKLFPQFPRLRDDMEREADLFFADIVHGDRSLLNLLDANYTYLNGPLARFYGIPNVHGEEFRRVVLTGEEGERRGGVLTMAAVLTVTGLPNRTSPVKRGKFILEEILGTPPPPPPPDVPALDNQADLQNLSVRQRMEAHRANPICASCHSRMDPLGFALENFDAIGRWRDHDGRFPIDADGALPDGEKFDGAAGLREVLMNHKDQFVQCFVEKLMTYALGRGTESFDAATIKRICAAAAGNDDRFSSVLRGIVHSDAFLERRGRIGSGPPADRGARVASVATPG